MHTGKADGMFTQERYLKEYLETRDKFHNPMLNFKPEKGEITDTYYHSAVFDSGVDARQKRYLMLQSLNGINHKAAIKSKAMIRITFWMP